MERPYSISIFCCDSRAAVRYPLPPKSSRIGGSKRFSYLLVHNIWFSFRIFWIQKIFVSTYLDLLGSRRFSYLRVLIRKWSYSIWREGIVNREWTYSIWREGIVSSSLVVGVGRQYADAAILGGWRCSAIKAIMMDGDNNPIRLRLFDEQNNRTKISIRLVPLSLQRDPTLSLSFSQSSSTLSREPY